MAATSDRSIRDRFVAALGADAPAAVLEGVVADAFPNLNVFSEGEDLIIVGGETHRLLIRRVGRDSFRVSENAAASASTNLLDQSGGDERDLDGLIAEIDAFDAL